MPYLGAIAFLVVLGAFGLIPALSRLWNLWTNDPLRSIGMLIVTASLILIVRAWHQSDRELLGTWWGLLPVALALLLNLYQGNLAWYWVAGRFGVNFLPPSVSLYLYASGVVLVFAGPRVWRKAGFPLALLLCAQPLPNFASRLVDLPLQMLSAHIARSFASLIGFPPSNPQLLKLMFTPDFGMFIAPGCDGMRGAVTLGYVALIAGYLKRASIRRWFLYASGAVLLGYLFNLLRLCALVLYYRIALGHPALERVAKQADYVIGGCLILGATFLFLWVISLKEDNTGQTVAPPATHALASAERRIIAYWKLAAFALLALLFAVPSLRAFREQRESSTARRDLGKLTSLQLDELMPRQFGKYRLNRAWQQKVGGANALESAVYSAPESDEIVLGVWLLPLPHSVHDSWSIRGEDPEMRASKDFVTAQGRTVSFDTAFYSDGITDTLAGNAMCSPLDCSLSSNEDGLHFALVGGMSSASRTVRTVPIYFRIETPHADSRKEVVYGELYAKVQSFLGGVDLAELSRAFQ